jgi:hypothetical protein
VLDYLCIIDDDRIDRGWGKNTNKQKNACSHREARTINSGTTTKLASREWGVGMMMKKVRKGTQVADCVVLTADSR